MSDEVKHRHKYIWNLFDMGDGIYQSCEKCDFIPKNKFNKEYWDFVASGRVSCMVFGVGASND